MNIQGRVFKYPDNVDTDVIIPARYLNTPDAKELALHCMEDIDADFVKKVQPGDVIVAGWNFGCGSSREHAAWAFEVNGIHTLIAGSFSRIFRQNMFNCGMLAIELPEADLEKLFALARKGEVTISVDLENSRISAEAAGTKEAIQFAITSFDRALVEAGGWVEFADRRY